MIHESCSLPPSSASSVSSASAPHASLSVSILRFFFHFLSISRAFVALVFFFFLEKNRQFPHFRNCCLPFLRIRFSHLILPSSSWFIGVGFLYFVLVSFSFQSYLRVEKYSNLRWIRIEIDYFSFLCSKFLDAGFLIDEDILSPKVFKNALYSHAWVSILLYFNESLGPIFFSPVCCMRISQDLNPLSLKLLNQSFKNLTYKHAHRSSFDFCWFPRMF